MTKSFHPRTEKQSQQLDQASDSLFGFCKAVLCLIVIVWLCHDVTQEEPRQFVHMVSFTSESNPYHHDGSTLNLLLDWVR